MIVSSRCEASPSRRAESACTPSLTASTLVASLALVSPTALAQDATQTSVESRLSAGFSFTEQSGGELYANACQACHMSDGKGATGAGAYPSLAGDSALAARRYVIHVVVNGQRAMPPVGVMMSDEQVAAVVNYVRTHFSNNYEDAVTVAEVKGARP